MLRAVRSDVLSTICASSLSRAPYRRTAEISSGARYIIAGFCNRTTIPLIQFAKIEEFCRKADLAECHLWEPFAERLQCCLGQFTAPVTVSSSGTVCKIHHPFILAPIGQPAGQSTRKGPESLAFNPSCKGYSMRHHSADTTVATWERVDVVQPAMGGRDRDDPSARGPRRNLKPFVKVIHECRDARR